MSILTMLQALDTAMTDLSEKKATLERVADDGHTATTKALSAHEAATRAAAETRDQALAAVAAKVETARLAYVASLTTAQDLKRQFDDQFSGLSSSDNRVRVS